MPRLPHHTPIPGVPDRKGPVRHTHEQDDVRNADERTLRLCMSEQDAVVASGLPSWAYSHQLEPILPEGHRAGDYSFRELMDRCREGVTA